MRRPRHFQKRQDTRIHEGLLRGKGISYDPQHTKSSNNTQLANFSRFSILNIDKEKDKEKEADDE